MDSILALAYASRIFLLLGICAVVVAVARIIKHERASAAILAAISCFLLCWLFTYHSTEAAGRYAYELKRQNPSANEYLMPEVGMGQMDAWEAHTGTPDHADFYTTQNGVFGEIDYWYSYDGDLMLTVTIEGGVVVDVTRYGGDLYWNPDGSPKWIQ